MSTFILKWSGSKFVQIEQMGKVNYVGKEDLVEYRNIIEGYDDTVFEELKFLNTGFLYKKDLVIVRVVAEAFQFSKMLKVMRSNNKYFLLTQKCRNLGYDRNFACYQIEFLNEYEQIEVTSLDIGNSYNYIKSKNLYYVINQNVIC